jgi:alkylation response protein AidB-like acyl-CoA dehydrogenase
MSTVDHAALVDRARAAGETIAPLAARIEAERRLPREAVDALVRSGAHKLLVPRSLGGSEASPSTFVAVLEELGRADGSVGWVAMIHATSGLMSALLPEPVAREIYGDGDALTCGVFAPMGRAVREAGGYRVSGRWPFASGCENSSWRMGGAIVASDPPDLLPGGAPHVRCLVFRADETRVIDTWNTSGLRGTGSHDLEVMDVLVPESRAFSFFTTEPWARAPLYRAPFFGVLASGIAAVAIGIARNAVDALVTLAKKKQPVGSKRGIAHREIVQLAVASAEAKVRGARALLRDALADVEAELERGPTLRARAVLRLAAAHATAEAASAVDLAYEAGGGTSIYATSPLQRAFRDVHTATQHVMVAKTATTLAGRILLDLESDTSAL